MGKGRGERASFFLATALALAGCGHSHQLDMTTDDSALNVYPANYKADILAGMHAYLNDPTGIRDAAVSQPALKQVGHVTRYVACVKFNAKRNATEYAGSKVIAASFMAGRFDDFVDTAKELCDGVIYAPFPELQKLPP